MLGCTYVLLVLHVPGVIGLPFSTIRVQNHGTETPGRVSRTILMSAEEMSHPKVTLQDVGVSTRKSRFHFCGPSLVRQSVGSSERCLCPAARASINRHVLWVGSPSVTLAGLLMLRSGSPEVSLITPKIYFGNCNAQVDHLPCQ